MKVGLFGGTFNPIHFGHLRAAEEVRETLKLDLIYFIPAASPPHKDHQDLASPEQRLHMVKLATKGNRFFMASDVEVRRIGRSFTVDTVRSFLSSLRQPATLYLMMGADAFAELETWKECQELVKLTNIAVHTRLKQGENGPSRVSLAALQRFGYLRKGDHYVHPDGQTLSFVATTFLPISATEIRHKLSVGESVRYLMPGDVVDYLERHRVY